MTELEEFSALLDEKDGWYERWKELTCVGDTDSGYTTISQKFGDERRWYRSCEVVTEAPSGNLYRWFYEDAYKGDGEDMRDDTSVVEVRRVTRMIEITEYEEV